ncbi:ell-associated factor Eaf-like [Thrips palmi]|uniref:Ell-associated factor Eaf-like n=1 Tax=Thrips palmi TaxID=161013 RepID=A0A6P8ZBF6_THRPL|nr:ell-associated factor Eaf-like [Thrips palmi]
MARSATSSDRSIPHLRDIFWSGSSSSHAAASAPRAAPWHGGHASHGSRRQDELAVNELAYQFQNDARVTGSRPSKGAGKEHFWSKQAAPQGQRSDHAVDQGNDSAISVGSTSEDEHQAAPQNKKKSKKSRARDNARTLTERDVKHLERHLSMKKTIRKKIMRDLQQAFVEDPTEFRVEDINSHEQLIQSLSFGTPSRHATRGHHAESNFLDMLRANGGTTSTPSCAAARQAGYDDQDSGHGSPRGSPTRELSSDRGMTPPSAQQQHHQQQQHQQHQQHHHQQQQLDDYEDGAADGDASGKKTSFWRRFTMKNKNKR